MSIDPREVAKALQVVKGSLSLVDRRLIELCLDIGTEKLEYEGSLLEGEHDIGAHLVPVVVQLEVLRERIDDFTEAYRLKEDLPPVTIRRDQKRSRNTLFKTLISELRKNKFIDPKKKEGMINNFVEVMGVQMID